MIRLVQITAGAGIALSVIVWAVCKLFQGHTAFATLGMLAGLMLAAMIVPEDVLGELGD